MNFSFLIGVGCAVILFMFGLFGETRPSFFLDPHAMIVVVLGTITAGLFSSPVSHFIGLLKGFFRMMVFGKRSDAAFVLKVVENVAEAARASKTDRNALANFQCVHPFLREGLSMIADGILSEPEMREVLYKRMEYYQRQYLSDAKTLQGLSKFPPAFGLLGAVTGMIGMMGNLGGGSDVIGRSMAVALVATFWGICLANVVLLPLSDYYKGLAEQDAFVRQIIIDGVLMVKRKEALPLIEEKMNSYLPPNKRLATTYGNAAPGGAKKAA
jgi:chemotaxis protein MotA